MTELWGASHQLFESCRAFWIEFCKYEKGKMSCIVNMSTATALFVSQLPEIKNIKKKEMAVIRGKSSVGSYYSSPGKFAEAILLTANTWNCKDIVFALTCVAKCWKTDTATSFNRAIHNYFYRVRQLCREIWRKDRFSHSGLITKLASVLPSHCKCRIWWRCTPKSSDVCLEVWFCLSPVWPD